MKVMEQEVSQLKVNNQQLNDTVRVKEKVCHDYNDTILQLKQVQLHITMVIVNVTMVTLNRHWVQRIT